VATLHQSISQWGLLPAWRSLSVRLMMESTSRELLDVKFAGLYMKYVDAFPLQDVIYVDPDDPFNQAVQKAQWAQVYFWD
jgi:hypothetical protein